MSIAPRDAKCPMRPAAGRDIRRWCRTCRSRLRGGRAAPSTPGTSSGTSTAAGPSVAPPSTGPTTSGMTSPALRTMTVSPGRTSLARTWSSLCSVASCDGRAADEHGLEHGERRRLPGAADRHHDVLEHRGALLGRELVGDRPARCVRGGAELLTLAAGRRPSPRRRRSRRPESWRCSSQCSQYSYTSSSVPSVRISGLTGKPTSRIHVERLGVALERGTALDRADRIGPDATARGWR